MTNQEIILRESIRLMNDGVIAGSGRYVTMTDNSGAEMTIELPEAIHTFSAWKKAGFAVKRGEHAIACFPVWKYTQRRKMRTMTATATALQMVNQKTVVTCICVKHFGSNCPRWKKLQHNM